MNDAQKTIALELLKLITGNENTDSLEIGSASKTGVIKIYGNFSDKEAFKKKLDTAFEIREYAFKKHKESETL